MEETTDALGLMEGREEEWRQESEEGRSTRQKSDGKGGAGRKRSLERKRLSHSASALLVMLIQDYRDLPSFNNIRCGFGAKLRRFVIVKLAPIHTLVNHS